MCVRGGGRKTEKVDGVLTPFTPNNRLKSLLFQNIVLNISSYSVYINISIFIKRNFNVSKKKKKKKKKNWTYT